MGTTGLWGDLPDYVVTHLGQGHSSDTHTGTVGGTGGKQLLAAAVAALAVSPAAPFALAALLGVPNTSAVLGLSLTGALWLFPW